MTARGRSRAIPSSAAARAARAHARSVRASVRHGLGAAAAAITTPAPARPRLAASSASEARSPTVEPSETSRISAIAARSGRTAPLGGQIGLEARRAGERDRAQRRGLLDVEANTVATLDRDDRGVLLAPGERPDEREAGRDRRD